MSKMLTRKHFEFLAEHLRLARPWNKSYLTYEGELLMWKRWRDAVISYCYMFDGSLGFDRDKFISATEE